MKNTQKEIAKRLKLSTATVSRALRDDPAIKQSTRDKVQKLAESLGVKHYGKNLTPEYKPHRIIGLFIKHRPTHQNGLEGDEVTASYLMALTEAASNNNVSLVVHQVNDEMMNNMNLEENRPPLMNDGMMNGIIFVHEFTNEAVEILTKEIPGVSIIHEHQGCDIDLIDTDNKKVIELTFDNI